MTSFQQTITDPVVPEKKTSQLTQQLTDQANNPLPGTQITTVKLTLYLSNKPETLINSCLDRDVKNANGCTLDADGLLTVVLAAADNPIVSAAVKTELHTARLDYTWASGAKEGTKEITFMVKNRARVT